MSDHSKQGHGVNLNQFHLHEATDRAYLCHLFIESTLGDHPLIEQVPSFEEKVGIASQALFDLYQDLVAVKVIDKLPNE